VRDHVPAAPPVRAVAGLLTRRRQSRASHGTVASTLSHNVDLGGAMDFRTPFDARLAALTVADVNAALKTHIDPAKLSSYLAGDFAKATSAASTAK